jgi:hypothetical protein
MSMDRACHACQKTPVDASQDSRGSSSPAFAVHPQTFSRTRKVMQISPRVLSILTLIAIPGMLQAQHLPESSLSPVSPHSFTAGRTPPLTHAPMFSVSPGRAGTPTLVASALLAAGFGAAAAGVIGHQLEMANDPMPLPGGDVGITGLVTGWVIGPALVTPLVVHLVNDRRGSLAAGYGAAALIAGAGILTAHADPPAVMAVAVVIGAPVLQAVSAVVMERLTDRRRN